jgi:hypothetical protein
MSITLQQFERIDSLMADLLRMGEFETCADPRGYIRTENRLFDACVDALGLDYANDFTSGLECAAHVVASGLLGTIEVLDEEDA